jgi:3-oxoacyl-[acyl-carrier protein] reductase
VELGLKNKIAFVAASSDGLGKAVAMELAKEGAIVIINGRNLERLKASQMEIEEACHSKIIAVAGDVSNPTERAKILETIFKEVDHIDILVTNTGGPPAGKFEDLSLEQWHQTYQLLLESAVALIKAALPGMKVQQWGRIIAITSQAVKQPVDNLILSNSVRASVVGLTKTLANELGQYNITVNNVMPGYTKTNRLLSLIDGNPDFKDAINDIPLKRFGNPDEFAAAVTFLASERASYITGTSLAVDGGWIKSMI